MKVEVSNGELMDKLSILELKLKNIADSKKLKNVNMEYNELNPLVQQLFKTHNHAIKVLYQKLAEINAKLRLFSITLSVGLPSPSNSQCCFGIM